MLVHSQNLRVIRETAAGDRGSRNRFDDRMEIETGERTGKEQL